MKLKVVEEEEEVTIIPPSYSLREAVGRDVDLRELFSEKVIAQAQQNVVLKQQTYLHWLAEDLDMLEHSYAALEHAQDPNEAQLNSLHLVAISIKSQGGMFGYDLVSEIAHSLYIFLHDFSFSKGEYAVIRKHIDVLRAILDQRINGMGGEVGHELLRDIIRLTVKFRKPL